MKELFFNLVDFSNFISFLANINTKVNLFVHYLLKVKTFSHDIISFALGGVIKNYFKMELVLGQTWGHVLLLQDFFFSFFKLFFAFTSTASLSLKKIRMFAWAWYQVPNLNAFPFYFQA